MTPETTEDRGHSELGSSSAKIWSNCPGSIFLLRQIPKQEAGEWAEEGTLAHTVAENSLQAFLEHKISGQKVTWTIANTTDEMHEHAHAYTQAVWIQGLEESITGKAYGLETQLYVDRRLDMYGYADFWSIYTDDRGKRAGLVGDYKYGFVGVAAEDNAQLAYLACALREEIRSRGKDLDYVRGFIFQPRAPTRDDGDPYDEYVFTAKALDRWHKKFMDAAHAIYAEKKPKFKVGEWCKYCKGQSHCTKIAKVLSKKTDLMLADTSNLNLPSVETLSKEVIAKIILHGEEVEDFIAACRKRAHAEMALGEEFPGIKRVYGSSRRKWIDDEETIVTKLRGIIPPEALYEQSLRPMTHIEKELNKLIDKKDAAAIMETLTVKGPPTVKLVPENDERPAIQSVEKLLDE